MEVVSRTRTHTHTHTHTLKQCYSRLKVCVSPSEWEERGKGRGRGKYVPASSSISQAAEPGSSGRVQKQHSWPAQATVEEQGGGKGNRSVNAAPLLLRRHFLCVF